MLEKTVETHAVVVPINRTVGIDIIFQIPNLQTTADRPHCSKLQSLYPLFNYYLNKQFSALMSTTNQCTQQQINIYIILQRERTVKAPTKPHCPSTHQMPNQIFNHLKNKTKHKNHKA